MIQERDLGPEREKIKMFNLASLKNKEYGIEVHAIEALYVSSRAELQAIFHDLTKNPRRKCAAWKDF